MPTTEHIAIIRFPQSDRAYEAVTELRALSGSLASVQVRGAALVERKPDGTLHVPEQNDELIGMGTATGGLVGMLVGVLGGPLGALLGFGTGTLIGGAFDVDRATGVESAVGLLSAEIPAGTTALIVDAVETTREPLDQFAARFGATVERHRAAEVAAEVEAADEAAEAARMEANRVLRHRKRDEVRAKFDEKVDAAKEKLPH